MDDEEKEYQDFRKRLEESEPYKRQVRALFQIVKSENGKASSLTDLDRHMVNESIIFLEHWAAALDGGLEIDTRRRAVLGVIDTIKILVKKLKATVDTIQ